jgi:hypothetical protein
MKGFKGFNKDLVCNPTGNNPFQYEIGKTYEIDGTPVRCTSKGFHFCENPLDVFSYYPPTNNRYCEVEGDGQIDKGNGEDSKVACSKLKIGLEIGLRGIIDAGVKFIFEKTKASKETISTTGDSANAATTGDRANAATTGDSANAATTGDSANAATTGYRANAATTGDSANAATTGDSANAATTGYRANAATTGDSANAATTGDRANAATTGYSANAATTGYRANAATTGDSANAATTGYRANAATTGDSANAATTGDRANAATTGYSANAEVKGTESIAAAIGINSTAKGALGCWIVLAEWYQDEENYKWHIKTVKSAKVDGKKIKADTWYKLNDGKFTECQEVN